MLTVTELAKELGVTRQTIYNRCRAAGVQLDDYVIAQDGNHKLLSADGAAAIRRAVRPYDHPAMEEPAQQPDPAPADPAAEADNIIEETAPDPVPDQDPGEDAMQAAQTEISRLEEKIRLMDEQIRDLRQQLAATEAREKKNQAKAEEREARQWAQIESLTMSVQAASVTVARLTSEAQKARPGLMARIKRLFTGSGNDMAGADSSGSAAEPGKVKPADGNKT